ncbi:response regulator [Spirosoma endbachense]|uniref:response regulator n=1 Tax=Spirosoma endbachense TaxID=2666025 RepID=UPI00139089FF|nr:response regulator [Spirosoma endbachense]
MKLFPILVIDDDPLLTDVVVRSAKKGFPEATFTHMLTATEAISYIKNLNGQGPKLIILDLNLSDTLSGFDFLTFLQGHSQARLVPVIVLTVSQASEDIEEAYQLGGTSFTNKPFSSQEWIIYFDVLRNYWYKTAKMPDIVFHKVE